MNIKSLPYSASLLLFTLVVFAVTYIGLLFSFVETPLAQIWFPTGLSLVIMMWQGVRYLPAVFIGTAINYVLLTHSFLLGGLLAIGSTVEAVVGYYLLTTVGFQMHMKRLRDVWYLFLYGGVVSTLTGAIISGISLYYVQPSLWTSFFAAFGLQWIGNTTGVLILTPMLLYIVTVAKQRWNITHVVEFLVTVIFIVGITYIIFHTEYLKESLNFSFVFLIFPFTTWSVIRFGIPGAVISTYLISLNAILSAQMHSGIFAAESYVMSIIVLDGFLIFLSTTSLALAALLAERDDVEQSLRQSEERYRIIAERTGQLVYDYTIATGHIKWSGAVESVTQYTPEEFATVDIAVWEQYIHPDDRAYAMQMLDDAMNAHTEYHVEYRFRVKDGSYATMLDRGTFLYGEEGIAYRMLGTMANITKQKRMEEELRNSEERFRVLVEKSTDGICLFDRRGRLLYATPSVEQIAGFTVEELKKMNFLERTDPAQRHMHRENIYTLFHKGESVPSTQFRFKHKNGSWIYLEGSLTNLVHNPHINAIVCNFRNVTERVQAQEKIQRSLEEKEILLKEVHHRVKNNMQIISSLLNLHSVSISDLRTRSLFLESQNRVKSMALVHELLYQTQDLARIDMAQYTERLISVLQSSFAAKTNHIAISSKISNISLDIDSAIPCGLIINELVTNALKHAFDQHRRGHIQITLEWSGDKTMTLAVSDDGKGAPNDLLVETRPTLGLSLVQALSEQLKGTIHINTQKGTTVAVTFPAIADTARIT